jgi:hypothetical protein
MVAQMQLSLFGAEPSVILQRGVDLQKLASQKSADELTQGTVVAPQKQGPELTIMPPEFGHAGAVRPSTAKWGPGILLQEFFAASQNLPDCKSHLAAPHQQSAVFSGNDPSPMVQIGPS